MQNKLTQKELPESEQPYEKLERYGAASLSDAELLAVIIRCGTPKYRAVDLAVRILTSSQRYPGLEFLHHCSLNELQRIEGIGRVKAIQLLCIAELSKRLSAPTYQKHPKLNSPKVIAQWYQQRLRSYSKEVILLLMLDTKGRLIAEKEISVGTVSTALLDPREVLITALSNEAVFLVVLHNHPSGDPTPSEMDKTVTKRLVKACEIVGILLRDHIILGGCSYYSMREKEDVCFSDS